MTRKVTVHPSESIAFTCYAQDICQLLNEYKKANPRATFAELAKHYRQTCNRWLSDTSIARYYYGCHQLNDYRRGSHTRVRFGARVAI